MVSFAVSEHGTEEGFDALGRKFRKAVDGENFEWLEEKLLELGGIAT